MTYWKGELVSRMTPQRATQARKEVIAWADNYAAVTGSADHGRDAKEFINIFDAARKFA